ncbi:MAG: hypothetical protein M1816_001352 [Peltula sp. TS41687]|nr:MAG: hypothetical protein M1816_001352 [Peltula sp. TS41687]
MDKLLPQIMAFPPDSTLSDTQYETQIKSLVQTLNRTPTSNLTEPTKDGEDPLDVSILQILDPTKHTLPYLYTLLAYARSTPEYQAKGTTKTVPVLDPRGEVFLKVAHFLEAFDPRQVRYAGVEFRKLIDIVLKSAKTAKKPLLAVRPLQMAILRLDPTPSTLTSTHVYFVRSCLEAKTYRAALPILDRDITEFPMAAQTLNSLTPVNKQAKWSYISTSSGISAKLTYAEHLQYHLYGAMVYIGLKKWERASEFLEFVITAPNAAARPKMPRPISAIVDKTIRAIAKPYDTIVDVFQSGDRQQLHREFEAGLNMWRNDNNTGLLYQVLESFQQFTIRSLENIYSTVSIGEISRRLSIDQETSSSDPFDVEQSVLKLISHSSLSATLSHPHPSFPEQAILTFSSPSHPPSSLTSHSTTDTNEEESHHPALSTHLQRLETLKAHIKRLDHKIGLSKDYIQWLHKANKEGEANTYGAGGNSNHGGGGGAGAGLDPGLGMGWYNDDAGLGGSDPATAAGLDPASIAAHDDLDATGMLDEDVMADL